MRSWSRIGWHKTRIRTNLATEQPAVLIIGELTFAFVEALAARHCAGHPVRHVFPLFRQPHQFRHCRAGDAGRPRPQQYRSGGSVWRLRCPLCPAAAPGGRGRRQVGTAPGTWSLCAHRLRRHSLDGRRHRHGLTVLRSAAAWYRRRHRFSDRHARHVHLDAAGTLGLCPGHHPCLFAPGQCGDVADRGRPDGRLLLARRFLCARRCDLGLVRRMAKVFSRRPGHTSFDDAGRPGAAGAVRARRHQARDPMAAAGAPHRARDGGGFLLWLVPGGFPDLDPQLFHPELRSQPGQDRAFFHRGSAGGRGRQYRGRDPDRCCACPHPKPPAGAVRGHGPWDSWAPVCS